MTRIVLGIYTYVPIVEIDLTCKLTLCLRLHTHKIYKVSEDLRTPHVGHA